MKALPVQGAFEAIERGRGFIWVAKGWAFDPDDPDTPVRLLLHCEEGVLGEFRADQFLPEYTGAGLGDGRCGFVLRLPDRLIDGRPHMLRIVVARDGQELPRKVGPFFFPSTLLGQVSGIQYGALHGWAIAEQALDRPPVLDIDIDGIRVATVISDQPAPELGRLLGSNGRHGFHHPLPGSILDGRPHRITVRFANTDQPLDGSPLEITLPAALMTPRRHRLERVVATHRAALDETCSALIREPLNHLADPVIYRRWLGFHEADIGARVAGLPAGNAGIQVHRIPETGGAAERDGFAAAVGGSGGDAVVLLEPGARLHPAFLPLIREALTPDMDIVYCDDDALDSGDKRHGPRFKPDWDPDRYRAFPYVGRACAIARHRLEEAAALVAAVERPSSPMAWAAAVVDTAFLTVPPGRVRHLPLVLHHGGTAPQDPALPGRAARVQAQLDRSGARARTQVDAKGRVRVRWSLPDPVPPVTLIIPTRDRLELLKACLDSIRATTRYPRYDIVVIDNDSRDSATLAYLDGIAGQPGLWVRRWPGAFNYAAMHNDIVAELQTPYVAFLNNDIEAIEPDWLDEMMGHAARPEVGAVGAKLLYPDGLIQHGGVLVGQHGAADHAQRAFGRDDDGYLHGAMVAQNVSAVTAACMVCRRTDYLEVGGMDAMNLAIAFNDVDLCLKLRAHGRRIIWTPHALLVHHESATRAATPAPDAGERERQEAAWLRATWRTDCFTDPFYSPNLSRGQLTHVDFHWPTTAAPSG